MTYMAKVYHSGPDDLVVASGGTVTFESGSHMKVPDDYTYETFVTEPVTMAVGGGAATGTGGDENLLLTPQNVFRYHILGTQTIISPV